MFKILAVHSIVYSCVFSGLAFALSILSVDRDDPIIGKKTVATASVTIMRDDVTMFNLYIVCNSNLHEKTPIMKQGAQQIATLAGTTVSTVEPLKRWTISTDSAEKRPRRGCQQNVLKESRCSRDVSRRWVERHPLLGCFPTKSFGSVIWSDQINSNFNRLFVSRRNSRGIDSSALPKTRNYK